MFRFWILALLPLLAVTALAQGGFGGGSAGGAGGGQGGRSGRGNGDLEGQEVSLNHILTPGDRGEWPFTAREGETFIFSASSTVFDPALEIVDAAGKVLATNDDIRPGDQTALLTISFPKGGSFKVLVKAFKSSGGGLYKFTSRRFLSIESPVGARTASSLGKSGAAWTRFPVKTGQTMVVSLRSAVVGHDFTVYAPSGQEAPMDSEGNVSGNVRRSVFRATETGDYYVHMNDGSPGESFAITIAIARVAPLTPGAPVKQSLEPGGLDIWTFEGKKGDLIRVSAKTAGPAVKADVDYVPPPAKPGEEAPAAEVEAPYQLLASDAKDPGSVVVLLRKAGSFQVSVSQSLGMATQYSLNVANGATPWTEGGATHMLQIGSADYWTFEGTRGQIVRLEATAKSFDIRMQLLTPSGEAVTMNDDGLGDHNALITSLLLETGRYIVQINGAGGSGDYALKRGPSPIRPLGIGARAEGTIGPGGIDIWSIRGKAGQTFLISVRSQEFDTSFRIFGPDSLEVAANDDGGNGTDSLVSFTLPQDGTYTIWVTGQDAGGKYTIRTLDLDH